MSTVDGRLRQTLLEKAGFATVVELVAWRGEATASRGRRALAVADSLAGHPRITALSITDGAGGHPAAAPERVAARYLAKGQELIIHVACRDHNRAGLEGRGWDLASQGLTNVLAVSGDFPHEAQAGLSRPVFDLDSVGLLQMYAGLVSPPFFLGAVVNNHKRFERELMPQYFKLALKIRSGAAFIISQIGYDARKQDELLRYMRLQGLDVPVLANVCILSPAIARLFHGGGIPGCVVTDELMAIVERQAASPDQGRGFFLELAAQQVAIARGLGFRGVYLSGHHSADEVERVLATADTYGGGEWQEFARELQFGWPDGFYCFEPDPDTGLNRDALNPAYLASMTVLARQQARTRVPLGYRLARATHAVVFTPGTPGFRLGAHVFGAAERHGLGRPLHVLEQAVKVPLFDCRDCGDCSLSELAYLCPESRCPKRLRNGPCGGTDEGRCEAADHPCVWALAYDRLKPYGEEEKMLDRPAVITDNVLRRTSAWANTFLQRDHQARRHQQDRLP